MNMLEFIIGDIIGVVAALLIYDMLVEIKWLKLAKRSWRALEKQLLGLYKKPKPTKRKVKTDSKGNDIY
jgi:predicted small secreted protein